MMAHVCTSANEVRVFIKNGKLRFQATKVDEHDEIVEKVTVTLPMTLVGQFTEIENMDEFEPQRGPQASENRIKDYTSEN